LAIRFGTSSCAIVWSWALFGKMKSTVALPSLALASEGSGRTLLCCG
jgi:hypothetical protein